MIYDELPFRESDQKVFIANNSEITKYTSWIPLINYETGINNVISKLI